MKLSVRTLQNITFPRNWLFSYFPKW